MPLLLCHQIAIFSCGGAWETPLALVLEFKNCFAADKALFMQDTFSQMSCLYTINQFINYACFAWKIYHLMYIQKNQFKQLPLNRLILELDNESRVVARNPLNFLEISHFIRCGNVIIFSIAVSAL